MSSYTKGLLLALAGVLVLSPDSLMVRLVVVDQWTHIFWRGLCFSGWLFVLLLVFDRKNWWYYFRKITKAELIMAVFFAVGTISFVTAITHTTVAKVLIIISTTPIFTSILSYFFLSEKISLRTLLVSIMVLLTFVAMFAQNLEINSWLGILASFISAIVMATVFVLSRRSKKSVMFAPLIISGFIAMLVSYPFSSLAQTDFYSFGVTFVLGLILAVAFILLTLAPKYLPAPEVSLVMLLETILGVAWAWIFLAEEPSLKVIIGGCFILSIMAINTILAIRK